MLNSTINTSISLDDVDEMLPINRVQPKKTKSIRLTQVHGSMRAQDILTQVKERNEEEKTKMKKKEERVVLAEKRKQAFTLYKEKCHCATPVCIVAGFRQCSVCHDVLKSQCSMTGCKTDGKKPSMISIPSSSSISTSSSYNNAVRASKSKAKALFQMMAYGGDIGSSSEEEDED